MIEKNLMNRNVIRQTKLNHLKKRREVGPGKLRSQLQQLSRLRKIKSLVMRSRQRLRMHQQKNLQLQLLNLQQLRCQFLPKKREGE